MNRDEFLDLLFNRLSGTGAAGRRVLVEVGDHLDDAIADGVSGGMTPEQAEVAAVARLGTPDEIAHAHALARQDLGAVGRALLMGAWVAGIVVAIAAGVSGLILEALGRIGSPELVAGDRNGVTYTAARCAEYLQISPGADSCAQAAAIDHWGEMVLGRLALGVLGLLALGALVIGRRTRLQGAAWRPPTLGAAVAVVAMFGAAALVLGAPEVVNLAVSSSNGTGAGITDGAVSLAFAAASAVWLMRRNGPRQARG
jgi:hypothetical protein